MTGIELGVVAGTTVTLGDAIMVGTTLFGAANQIAAGQAQRESARYQEKLSDYRNKVAENRALQMEQQAGQERAASQRAAIEQRRQAERVESSAVANIAAGGGSALDPTAIKLLGDIGTEGEIRALTAAYEGEERARGLEFGADLERAGGQGELFAGQAARRAGENAYQRSFLKAGATLLEGASSFNPRRKKTASVSQSGQAFYDRYGTATNRARFG